MTMQQDPLYTVTVRSPDGAEVVYPLGRDMGVLVGRDETCDIVLPSSRVSRRHARFFTEGEQLHVEDMGSQNGVYVGGVRITGVNPVRPGPAIEVGEFQIRIRRTEPEQSTSGEPSVMAGTLVGTGKQKGLRLDLPPKAIIGRDRSADVVVQDDSVSRKHAEIVLENGRVLLRDLGSSNGTFHNERPLTAGTDVALGANDVVGFGDTRFRFVASAALNTGQGGSRSAVLVGALVLLIAGLVVASQLDLSPSGSGPVVTGDDSSTRLASEATARGQALVQEGQWSQAIEAFKEALYHDPIAGDVRVQLRRARREQKQEELLAEVDRLTKSGQPAEALDTLLTISPESRAYVRARLRVRDLAGDVSRRLQATCTSAIGAKEHARIAETCSRFLDLSCHTQEPDKNLLKSLAEARSKAGVSGTWSCPAEWAHWFGTSTGATDQSGLDALAKSYPDESIRTVVVAYYRGGADDARREAEKLKGASRTKADELVRQMGLVDNRYKDGSSALMRNDLSRADASFQEALDLDAALVAAPARSALAGRIRATMSQAYARQGREAFSQKMYAEAFRAWSRGLNFAPTDGALLDGIRELEAVATDFARQGCSGLERAATLTLPGSSLHTRIQERIAEQCQ